MDDSVLPSKLLTKLSQASETVHNHDFIQIFSHYDADGISAAAIVAKTLLRAGKEFQVTLFPTLNDENMDMIRGSSAECILLTDLGASYIKELESLGKDVIVLDHHTVSDDSDRICYANPHMYGIDGMTSGCGATMALLFAVTVDEANWDLVQVAFAGIAGDRQHINGLLGLNAHLLSEGVKRGFIVVSDGSLIPPGRLSSELFLTTDPYIRGVSGDHDGVSEILMASGISGDKSFGDLSDDEKRRLSSLIALKLVEQGVILQTMSEIARTRYDLPSWNMDAEAFASLLNGCGRMGLGGIGISAGMGDAACLSDAGSLESASREQIIRSVLDLDSKGLTQMTNIQWFDSSSSGFTGMVCGIAMQCIGNPDKPTIGINMSDEMAKISSRGMWTQLDGGVDLSSALDRACRIAGGRGGGHRIASGGSCPSANVDVFLSALDTIIGEQLSSAR